MSIGTILLIILGSALDWSASGLAVQRQLGLLSQRRVGPGAHRVAGFGGDRPVVMSSDRCWCSRASRSLQFDLNGALSALTRIRSSRAARIGSAADSPGCSAEYRNSGDSRRAAARMAAACTRTQCCSGFAGCCCTARSGSEYSAVSLRLWPLRRRQSASNSPAASVRPKPSSWTMSPSASQAIGPVFKPANRPPIRRSPMLDCVEDPAMPTRQIGLVYTTCVVT